MSVINTMLRDLERRGAGSEASGDQILGGLNSGENHYQDNRSSSKTYFFGLVSVIAVIAIVIGGYYISPYKLVATSSSQIDPVAVKAHHVEAVNEKQQVQLARSESDAVEPTTTKAVVASTAVAMQTEADNKKAAPVEKQSTQSQEPAPTSQIVSSASSAPVVAAAAPVASGIVKRDAPVVSPQKNAAIQTAAKNVAKAEPVQRDAEDDAAETTAESLRVVTKQQRAFTPAEQSRQAYATAVTMYDKGRKQEAKSSLTQSLALDPSNADACRLLAVIYLEDGRADLAADTLEGGLKSHDKDQNLLRLYVQALVKQKKFNQAIYVMGRRVELASPADLGYLAGLYQKDNDHIEAVKYYAQALQLVPSKSVWWLGQGISLEILKQYKEAMESYQKSVNTGELSTNLMEYAINRMKVIKQHHPDLQS